MISVSQPTAHRAAAKLLPAVAVTILSAEGKTPDIAALLINMSHRACLHSNTYLVDMIDPEMADEIGYCLGDGCIGVQISTEAEFPEYAKEMSSTYPDLLFHYRDEDHAETIFLQQGKIASRIPHLPSAER